MQTIINQLNPARSLSRLQLLASSTGTAHCLSRSSALGRGFASSSLARQSEQADKRPVFFKVSAGGKALGTIKFKLYDEEVPKTAKNFRELCKGFPNPENTTNGIDCYKGGKFHRIIPSFMIQGGDITRHNGSGGRSIYGNRFNDENFIHKHSKPGLLSMANAGANTNGSQFFITTEVTSWLDGKHVVFGEVTEGFEVVKQIEALGSQSGKPKTEVTVEDCGVLEDSAK
ncbi:hypothetical protein PTTG_02119 [Puccinia triticina 1-1 BBBD Race 1]|uniref:Peptidyl-prolyl cis-trans isomerase n=2 Tax=Puccinia triticina TaxID=208348 RepID=A0A180GTG8_PUCT1|nr:uncharacterized protein PtA15_5A256 [Puccinia triticina]OAV96096.1 hypothetical protein PTTG_02119 [Puccinia triticina 1-1 BBBD Race 1]WAQ84683.1 hypothetical protein PtA15_5A256 [Puccinia triticina]WAR58028.1 hypothetical protein PtB15_5B259 [Puccinia triticina]